MADDEVREVLSNWIDRALAPPGQIPEGTDPAAWVADRFAAWWRSRVEEPLAEAERAVSAIGAELERLGGWDAFGEALHELTHLRSALSEIRTHLGLTDFGVNTEL